MNVQSMIVMLTAAAMASGQPPQGKGRQKGGQRDNPPGGISRGALGYNGLGLVRLLEVPEIQAELKFTNDDKSALPLLRDELRDSSSAFEKSLADAAQDRNALLARLATRSKEVDQQMAEILGDRLKRFQEIRRQAFGVLASATADAVVRESLGITEDQRGKFNSERDKIVANIDKGANRGDGKSQPGVLNQKGREFAAKEEELFLSLLTESQAAKWKQLVGQPLEIPEEVVQFVRRGRYERATDEDRAAAAASTGNRGMKGTRKKGGKRQSGGNEGDKMPQL